MFNTKKIALLGIFVVAVGYFIFGGSKQKESLDNTLRIAVTGQPESLDPSKALGAWTGYILQDIQTGLVEKDASGHVVPGLAKSWSISKDGKTYVFKLREDAKWSDGTPITAEDFVYSFKRAANPEEAGKWVSLYYYIKGVKDYASGKANADVVKVEALDEKTLKIELEAPVGYFLGMLTHYSFSPVPKHVIEQYGKDWVKPGNYVTTGAYKVTEYKAGSYIKAVKNENYYDAENVAIENVIYYLQEDLTSLTQRFKNNEIDVIREFPTEQYESLLSQYGEDVVRVSPWIGVYYYALNIEKLDNVKVREAMSLAIDREFIAEKVLGVKVFPAYSVVPSNMEPYKPYEYTWKSMAYEERLAKAKKMMEQQGYSENNRLVVELAYNTQEDNKKVAIAVADMLKSIYVELKLVNREVTSHYATLRSGDFEVGRAGWIADYEDPSALMQIFLSYTSSNYSKYEENSFDSMYSQATKVTDEEARFRIYRQLEKKVLEAYPIIPIYHYSDKNIVSDRVEGWVDNISDIHLTKYLRLKK